MPFVAYIHLSACEHFYFIHFNVSCLKVQIKMKNTYGWDTKKTISMMRSSPVTKKLTKNPTDSHKRTVSFQGSQTCLFCWLRVKAWKCCYNMPISISLSLSLSLSLSSLCLLSSVWYRAGCGGETWPGAGRDSRQIWQGTLRPPAVSRLYPENSFGDVETYNNFFFFLVVVNSQIPVTHSCWRSAKLHNTVVKSLHKSPPYCLWNTIITALCFKHFHEFSKTVITAF